MKKRYPIILLIWPYLGLASIEIGQISQTAYNILGFAYFILTIVVYVGSIIYVCRIKGAGMSYQLAFWDMLIKLVHLPLFLLMLLMAVLMVFSIVVPALIFFGPFFAVMIVGILFFLMGTTSSYGISALIRAWRNKEISTGFAVAQGVLHFLFLLDTVSAVLLFLKLRKQRKQKIMTSVGNAKPPTSPL